MLNKSIAEDIKHTGWAIRDWLGPYYMLGGAVAFGIAMLTLLDQDGSLHLTRIVGVVLFLATVFAWCYHFYRQHQQALSPEAATGAAPSPQAKFHGILLAVTLFFTVGIVVSEALMHNHRKDAGAASAAKSKATAPQVKTQDSLAEDEEHVEAGKAATAKAGESASMFQLNIPNAEREGDSSAAVAPSQVLVPSAPLPPAQAVGGVTAKPSADEGAPAALPSSAAVGAASVSSAAEAGAAAKPAAPVTTIQWPSAPTAGSEGAAAQRGTTTKTALATIEPKQPAAAPKAAVSVDAARCRRVTVQFSQGEDLSAEDLSFMRNSCRQK